MEEKIINAIENKKVLQFFYDDKFRIVEPHVFGSSKKTNSSDLLRGYQVMGDSNRDTNLGWRLFSLDKIVDIDFTGDIFSGEREYYNPNDSAMEEIYINI